ncbi:MAG: hypothetical protein WAV76_05515 [Bacteroidota bacterium]
MKTLQLSILMFFCFLRLSAQVAVAPPIVFCSPDHRFGDLIIENRTTTPQEVSVEFKFGYPLSDSLGAMNMQFGDTATEKELSLKPYIRLFPKKFIMQPGDKQIVRIAANVPASLKDGFYWTRVITTSAEQKGQVDTIRKDITTTLNYIFKQVTTAVYQKGMLTNGITITGKGVAKNNAGTLILWYINKNGNAPYFGTATAKIFDADDVLVDEIRETIAVYVSMMKCSLLTKNLPAGTYTVDISLAPQRNDIPADQIRYCSAYEQRFTVVLP